MKKLGKYKILREINKGSMGVIYEALDESLGRKVALKTMKEDLLEEENMIKRFRNEARAAAKLNHPNIITVHDFGKEDDVFFIVMELLDGQNLKEYVAAHTDISLSRITEIIIAVADALAYAHKQGVVHRDIKPANIMLLDKGVTKITDFGIAHLKSSDITRTGVIVGTPDYMSPEQVLGNKLDARTDIFSLGSVFFELVTGRKPFKGNTINTVMFQIAGKEPPTFEALNLDVPFEIDTVITRSLIKDPLKRYQTMGQMLSDLKAAYALLTENKTSDAAALMAQTGFMVSEAKRLITEERYREARATLERALEIETDNTVIGELLERVNNSIRKEKARSLKSKLLRANSAAETGKHEKALAIALEAKKISPDNTEVNELISNMKKEVSAITGETLPEFEARIDTKEKSDDYELPEITEQTFETAEVFQPPQSIAELKKMPKDIRTLIDEADRLYYQRKTVIDTVFSTNTLMKAHACDSSNYEICWRLCRNYYDRGWLLTSVSDKKRMFNQGIVWGKEAVKLKDNRVEGHYWLAVNIAKWGDVNGIFRGITILKKLLAEIERALELDESYAEAGPYRVLGRMKFRIPAVMGGGVDEAIQLFKKALLIEPRAPETLLFLSEAYITAKKYDLARKHLTHLLTMTPLPYQIFETNSTRKDAKLLLAKLEKLKNKAR